VEIEISPQPTEAERAAILAALAAEKDEFPNLVLPPAQMFGNQNVRVCGVTARRGAAL
jgi:hypothetical protein